ncbi:MAG: C13 family peptidase [Sphingobium sp.]
MEEHENRSEHVGDETARNSAHRELPVGPGIIAIIWALTTLVIILETVVVPSEYNSAVTSNLYLAGAPIFAALVASSVLRLREAALKLIASLAGISFLSSAVYFFLELENRGSLSEHPTFSGAFLAVELLLCALLIWKYCAKTHSRKRRAGAIASYVAVFFVSITLIGLDPMFWRLSSQVAYAYSDVNGQEGSDDEDDGWGVEADRLWEAQPKLLDASLSSLREPQSGRRNIYTVAVAAQGTQKLFSREAHNALQAFSANFGSEYQGGILLSNGGKDFFHAPLATRGHLGAVARAIGEKVDHDEDVVVMYLTAHGSRDAELVTALPTYSRVQPISAAALSDALKESGIGKRVIIISACFAGSWIPALANDDTIVIAAAAADRTSFGCSDEREMTFFGEAFLKGPLSNGASLQKSFEGAKATLTKWEKAENLTPSKP